MKNNIEKENNEMLRNQIKEAQHHSSELKAVVSTSTQVEPWVVAKMERATTDLSDIAHYLDGRKDMKMATGGPIEKYNLKNKTKYWIYDGDNLEMAGTVSILPNNYIQIKDPKGFVYSLSLLEHKYKNLKFKIYEKFAKGGLTPSQEAKVGKVMHEFKEGKLHSGSKQGPVVTERKQGIAIALAEANAMKMKYGGPLSDESYIVIDDISLSLESKRRLLEYLVNGQYYQIGKIGFTNKEITQQGMGKIPKGSPYLIIGDGKVSKKEYDNVFNDENEFLLKVGNEFYDSKLFNLITLNTNSVLTR